MIKFIGTGSAFNTERGNNSAYIRKGNSLILIDCGGTVFEKLQKLNLLKEVSNLYIIITHTHPDHVGSLGDLIFYAYYILKKKATILFPDKDHIINLLKFLGVDDEKYKLNAVNEIEIDDGDLGVFKVRFKKVNHVDTIPSYGFLLKYNNEEIYYSGDSKELDSKILCSLMNGEISKIYHDTCGLDYDGNVHMSFKKLCHIVPNEYRNKVYCMHLDNNISKEEIIKSGFNAV